MRIDTRKLGERARDMAEKAHAGQMRGGKRRDPYITHCREVAELTRRAGGSDAEIAAAWLHDAAEDADVTLSHIAEVLSVEVAHIVKSLTNPPELKGISTKEKKEKQAQRIQKEGRSAKLIKLADQISNLRLIVDDPPVQWSKEKCRAYIVGAGHIAKECAGISEFLDDEFQKAYQAAWRTYAP